jgi:hypothetical protein
MKTLLIVLTLAVAPTLTRQATAKAQIPVDVTPKPYVQNNADLADSGPNGPNGMGDDSKMYWTVADSGPNGPNGYHGQLKA